MASMNITHTACVHAADQQQATTTSNGMPQCNTCEHDMQVVLKHTLLSSCIANMQTCFVACYSCKHHMTGVNGVNEIWGKGTPLPHPLDWAFVCLVNQNDAL